MAQSSLRCSLMLMYCRYPGLLAGLLVSLVCAWPASAHHPRLAPAEPSAATAPDAAPAPEPAPIIMPSMFAASPALPGRAHLLPPRKPRPPSLKPRVSSTYAGPAGASLTYLGGRIVSGVHVVQVLWGSGSYLPEVQGTVSPDMVTRYRDILASPFMDWLAEYDTSGITSSGGLSSQQALGRGTVQGPFTITPSVAAAGTTIDDTTIQSELASQISAGNLPAPALDASGNPDTYYALFFPSGVTITLPNPGGTPPTSCVDFCAYHSTFQSGSEELYYGVHPDLQPGSACSTGCGAGSSFQAQSSVSSHELIETLTDAETGLASTVGPPMAWRDTGNGNEIGDECNALHGLSVGGDGTTGTVQAEWSNLQNTCAVSAPVSVVHGSQHSCVLTSAGAVQCWGLNSHGQLGNGTTTSSATPVAVSGLTGTTIELAAGDSFTCALSSTGAVQCWGQGNLGQLGNNATLDSSRPVQVSGMAGGIHAIAAGGGNHACALLSSAVVKCWGQNSSGQLGNNSQVDSPVPVSASMSATAVAIAVGATHSCAIVDIPSSAGDTYDSWCWGANGSGQLGIGSTAAALVPTSVGLIGRFLDYVAMVTAGTAHTCWLLQPFTGKVVCAGDNTYGQLGTGDNSSSSAPVAVSGLSAGNTAAISAGDQHTCAVDLTGGVTCWGRNAHGQLGDGTTTDANTPQAVSTNSQDTTFLSAGTARTCIAGGIAGTVRCFGSDASGQLGDGGTTDSPLPVAAGTLALFGSPASQTITLAAIGNQPLANTHVTLAPTASSGLAVVLASNTPSVCDVAGYTVSLRAAGLCTLQADQPGNPANAPAPQVVQSFNVLQGSTQQTITFGTAPTVRVGTSGTVSATGGASGNPVTFASQTPAVCSLLGTTVTGVTVGNCTIQASQAGNATYAPATASQTFAVTQGSQSIHFGVAPVLSVGAQATLTATGGASGNPVVFSSNTTAVCTVTGATVTGVATGTCTVLANQAGNTNYAAAPQASQSFTVSAAVSSVTSMVSGGDSHTCALNALGAVLCWGAGGNGQLGNGSTAVQKAPVEVSGMSSGIRLIASGGFHSCALSNSGGVFCWGNDAQGQLGDGNTQGNITHLTAVAATGLSSGVVSLSAGTYHTCAVDSTQAVWCWGYNAEGQLGIGSTSSTNVPTAVSSLGAGSGVVTVVAGGNATCALTSQGALWCWGAGSLGDAAHGVGTITTSPVEMFTGVDAITLGQSHMCALAAGTVYCWGDNSFSQLGDGGGETSSDTPMALASLGGTVSGISAGPDSYHTCATTGTGGAWCWGYNGYGELGNLSTNSSNVPVAVHGLSTGVAQVTTGYEHSCALLGIGSVDCWGLDSYGQLGDGTSGTSSPGPLTVLGVGGTGTLVLTAPTAQAQTISFAALPPRHMDTPVTLQASASSGLAVAFSSQSPTTCTVSNGVVTLLRLGTCVIAADQAGNASFQAAPQVTRSFQVLRRPRRR